MSQIHTQTAPQRDETADGAATPQETRSGRAAPRAARWDVPYVRWGLATGVLGAGVTALFFLGVDAIAARPLATPSALGAILFLGEPFDLSQPIRGPLVVGYTLVHGAMFVALASVASALLLAAERRPHAGAALVATLSAVFFVALTAIFLCFAALLDLSIWNQLGGAKVAAANGLAAIAMALMLGRALAPERSDG